MITYRRRSLDDDLVPRCGNCGGPLPAHASIRDRYCDRCRDSIETTPEIIATPYTSTVHWRPIASLPRDGGVYLVRSRDHSCSYASLLETAWWEPEAGQCWKIMNVIGRGVRLATRLTDSHSHWADLEEVAREGRSESSDSLDREIEAEEARER